MNLLQEYWVKNALEQSKVTSTQFKKKKKGTSEHIVHATRYGDRDGNGTQSGDHSLASSSKNKS